MNVCGSGVYVNGVVERIVDLGRDEKNMCWGIATCDGETTKALLGVKQERQRRREMAEVSSWIARHRCMCIGWLVSRSGLDWSRHVKTDDCN